MKAAEVDAAAVFEPAHAVDAGDKRKLSRAAVVRTRGQHAHHGMKPGRSYGDQRIAFVRNWISKAGVARRRTKCVDDCGVHFASPREVKNTSAKTKPSRSITSPLAMGMGAVNMGPA